MTIRDLLKEYKIEDVKIVMAYLLDLSFGSVMNSLDLEIEEEVLAKALDALNKHKEGLPIQYAIGKWDFYGRTFKINQDVLIPRPETELLVEEILKEDLKDKSILDIGTGSGAIAISLALEAKDAKITASDISIKALEIAKLNAKDLCASVEFIESDLFENINEKFDIIVSNPPYISQKDYDNLDSELFFEPRRALLGGQNGYEIYERIVKGLKNHLKDGGKVLFEIGYDQGIIVKGLLEDEGFTDLKVIKDYGGKDRIVMGSLKVF